MNRLLADLKGLNVYASCFNGNGNCSECPINGIGGSCKDNGKFLTKDICDKLIPLLEAGRLVKLPCKVGDTVYQLGALRRTIAEHPVSSFSISSGIYMLLDDGLSKIVADTRDFGKTIFLTREAAEAALNVPDTNVGNIEEGAGQ